MTASLREKLTNMSERLEQETARIFAPSMSYEEVLTAAAATTSKAKLNIGAEVMGLRPRLLTPKAIYEKTETDFQEIMRYRDDWPEGDDRRDIIPIYSIREARKAEEKDEDEVKESESDSDSSNPPGYGTKASVAQEGDLAQDLESTTPQDLSAPPPSRPTPPTAPHPKISSQPARAELTAPLADVSSQLDEATGGGLAPVKMVKLRRKSMFSKKHSKGSTSGKTKSRPALSARYLRHTALSLARSRRMDSESLEALESPDVASTAADSFAVSPAEPSSSSPPSDKPSSLPTAPQLPQPTPQAQISTLRNPSPSSALSSIRTQISNSDKPSPLPTSLRSAQHSPPAQVPPSDTSPPTSASPPLLSLSPPAFSPSTQVSPPSTSAPSPHTAALPVSPPSPFRTPPSPSRLTPPSPGPPSQATQSSPCTSHAEDHPPSPGALYTPNPPSHATRGRPRSSHTGDQPQSPGPLKTLSRLLPTRHSAPREGFYLHPQVGTGFLAIAGHSTDNAPSLSSTYQAGSLRPHHSASCSGATPPHPPSTSPRTPKPGSLPPRHPASCSGPDPSAGTQLHDSATSTGVPLSLSQPATSRVRRNSASSDATMGSVISGLSNGPVSNALVSNSLVSNGFDSTSSAPGASSQLEPRLSAGTSSQLESPPNFHTQVGRSRLSSAPGTASQLESSLNSCLDPPNPILLRGLHPTSAQPSPRTPNPPRRPGPPPASAAVPVGGGGGRGGGLGVRHVASARATGSPVVGLSLDQVAEDEEELLALQSTSTPSPKPGRIWSAQAIRTSLPDSTLQAADRPGYQEPANRPGYQQPTGTVGADRPGYMQPTSKARPQSGRMMRSSIGHPGIESAMYATSGNKSALNTGTPLTLDASYAKMGISSTASKITSLRQDAENARLPMRSRRHSSGTFWN